MDHCIEITIFEINKKEQNIIEKRNPNNKYCIQLVSVSLISYQSNLNFYKKNNRYKISDAYEIFQLNHVGWYRIYNARVSWPSDNVFHFLL